MVENLKSLFDDSLDLLERCKNALKTREEPISFPKFPELINEIDIFLKKVDSEQAEVHRFEYKPRMRYDTEPVGYSRAGVQMDTAVVVKDLQLPLDIREAGIEQTVTKRCIVQCSKSRQYAIMEKGKMRLGSWESAEFTRMTGSFDMLEEAEEHA